MWLLAASVLVALCVVPQPRVGWNANTRLDLVFAVVDHGELHIDRYHATGDTATQDVAFYDGHYFSDKVIGLSLMAMPLYGAIRVVAAAVDAEPSYQFVQYALTRGTVALSAALAVALLAMLMMRLGGRPKRVLIAVAGVFYGSMLFGYSTVFFPYAPGIAACFAALLLLHSPPLTTAKVVAIGALLGTALLFDLTFVIVVAAIATLLVLQLMRRPRRWALRAAVWGTIAAAVPVGVFVVYSIRIFGSPTIPYEYEVLDYFRDGMSRGVMGVTAPKSGALWFLTVHPFRGVLFWSPWVVVALVGGAAMCRRASGVRPLGVAVLAAFVGSLLFNAGYYQWWSGNAMGPRLMIPMFALVPLGLLPACRGDAPKALWPAAWVALLVSVLLSWPLGMIDPQPNVEIDNETLGAATASSALHPHQFDALGRFYRLEWGGLKQPMAISNTTSFLLCIAIGVGGLAFACAAAGRGSHEATGEGDRLSS